MGLATEPMDAAKTCSVEGCENLHLARGWCRAHYLAWKSHGDPLKGKKYVPRGSGSLTWHGYRRIRVDGKDVLEHRHVMEKVLGRPLLRNEVVHHRDGVTVNNDPANLELMPWSEHQRLHNLRSGCKRGHPWTPDNTRYSPTPNQPNYRVCRACDRERARRYREDKRGT